jgi:hypothetical protein
MNTRKSAPVQIADYRFKWWVMPLFWLRHPRYWFKSRFKSRPIMICDSAEVLKELYKPK